MVCWKARQMGCIQMKHKKVLEELQKILQVSSFMYLCSAFECCIVNGLCDKRFNDDLTFISQTGGSVVNYFIVSSELCFDTFLSSFEIVPRVV